MGKSPKRPIIESREDFIAFVEAMRNDLLADSPGWENPTLERFPGALAAWATDIDGYFHNRGEQVPLQPG